VTGEYGLGRPGLESCLREKPDLRVVDPVLADINGIVVAREVRTALSDAKILVITGHPSERLPAMLLGQPVLEQLQASGQLVHPDQAGVALKAVRLPVLGAAIAARELQQGLRKVAQESPDQRPHVLVTQALGEVSESVVGCCAVMRPRVRAVRPPAKQKIGGDYALRKRVKSLQ